MHLVFLQEIDDVPVILTEFQLEAVGCMIGKIGHERLVFLIHHNGMIQSDSAEMDGIPRLHAVRRPISRPREQQNQDNDDNRWLSA